MQHTLKNGRTLVLRECVPGDGPGLIAMFNIADTETRFLSREPGEFDYTVEQEEKIIRDTLDSPDRVWYVPVMDGRIVGQCSASLKGRRSRFRHRAGVGFVLLREYWDMGIGGKMMEACLAWCREKGAEQVELEVVADNMRALRMYLSFGFRVCGTRPHALRYADGSYGDEYMMVKTL